MSRPQGIQRNSIFFLTPLLLFSLLIAACANAQSSTEQTQPAPSAKATARVAQTPQAKATPTVPPPPSISADAGWKIVYQTTQDSTALAASDSKNFTFNQFPSSASFVVYGTCTGNGSVEFTIKGASADGASTFTSVLSVTCTPSGTSASANLSSSGGGNGSTVSSGGVAGVKNTSDVVEKATISLKITGPIKWELAVEEPA